MARAPLHLQDPQGYLSRQLIAYIGNKRRVLPDLERVFRKAAEPGPGCAFLDPFAGSGAVSRLARFMGYRVHANDWEPYSRIVNRAHLCVSPSDMDRLFTDFGGGANAFDFFNTLIPSPGYIAGTYSPRSTADADYRTERLFYSRENGVFIDTVRDAIEERWPGWDLAADQTDEKTLLLSALVYEAATHVNTSGVFKAYHKGFGGHGRDALGRILTTMRLEFPVLFEGAEGCTMDGEDAADFLSHRSGRICYLDPPYTIHQYGSNYHLLNTIVLWDKPPVSDSLDGTGRLVDKAGIRKDWKRTKSRFCSAATAADALRELLDRTDAGKIVLSYNTDGLIGLDEIRDILGTRGNVEFFGSEYPAYRGGRQSRGRRIHTMEVQFLVTRPRRYGKGESIAEGAAVQGADAGREGAACPDFSLLEREIRKKELEALLRRSFVPGRLTESFPLVPARDLIRGYGGAMPGKYMLTDGGSLTLTVNGTAGLEALAFQETTGEGRQAAGKREGDVGSGKSRDASSGISRDLAGFAVVWKRYRIVEPFPGTDDLPDTFIAGLSEKLRKAACADNAEECEVILHILMEGSNGLEGPERRYLCKRFIASLRRLAHRKYADEFGDLLNDGTEIARSFVPPLPWFEEGLENLRRIFQARITG